MKTVIEKHTYYTDQERYEWARKYRISGLTMSEFARQNNLRRETLRGWVSAYQNISGKFINVSTVCDKENHIIENDDLKASILSDDERKQIMKNHHFTRFDHSTVIIEYRDVRITTSLEQAERLLEKIL